MARTFLKAEWRKLVLANYKVDAGLLTAFVPHKTALDLWENTCYVSLVGFMFMNTKLKGIPIPFHRNFEEVNLRFYVKHRDENGQWKRGVVFIKEIVPKPALTFVARSIYNEPYQTMPMQHEWIKNDSHLEVKYSWKHKKWNSLKVQAAPNPIEIIQGSEEEFITEHYWGYTKTGEKKTSEYEVEHPKWQVYPVKNYAIDVDFGQVYGSRFADLNNQPPQSVFLAEGSEITVNDGKNI